MNYIWPLCLVVLSNVMYQICAKSVPDKMNPLASLTVTYTVGALVSLVLYFSLGRNFDLIGEYKKLNWAPFVLGLSVVGLEVGFIYCYKVGWSISILQIVQGAILAMILIVVGYFAYKESLSWNKIAGIVVCMAGLGLINLK